MTLGGCGVFHAIGPSGGVSSGAAVQGSARIERREVEHHPPINLVLRLGDPLPALAFASAHDSGSVASVALSALLLARLQARGISDLVSIPTESGVALAVLCAESASAPAFVAQITAALATPLAERDEALPLIQEHLAALRSRAFAGRAEATLADCSGELGQGQGVAVPDVRTPAGRATVDEYRKFAFATRASAFAAVGSKDFVNAAASDLERSAEWPTGDAPEDAWPSGDALDTDVSDGPRRLAVALRVADAGAALGALHALTREDASLGSRLRTFLPGYRLDRAVFQDRPRGACLRVDLALPDGEPAPTPKDLARAIQLITEEMHATEVAETRALDENIIAPSDPRQAAARAAWRALTGRQEPGTERRFVALSVHPKERPAFAGLSGALSDIEARPARAPLEIKLRAESGQGQMWVLLGSPCGTLGESNDDAGQSALALTLAARATSAGVLLEPWLTTDAVGLLAHSARLPDESATQQAERLARALARALSEGDASGDSLALAQAQLFAAVGSAPRPGYARLLDALSPDHSAWLEPRGTWASLSVANRGSVAARARDLLRGPLRVAVLANEDDAQATVAARTLERWFAPWRDDARRCQATAERAAHSGEVTLTIPDGPNTEIAYVGLPFASRLVYEREAEAFSALLNDARGPLASALSVAQLSASAHASIIGGGRRAALVIEVSANEDDARRATMEVRRTLDRLLTTQWSNDELSAAQHTAEQRAQGASLDPRRRIVDLWRGSKPESSLSRSSLREFQRDLTGAAQVVVYVLHRD